jgi:AmiR/NasT family two-component response regulator
VCRALKVLCAAADRERLAELKRAAVGTHWELVGGASSVHELEGQMAEFEPDVVVVDAGLGDRAVDSVRGAGRPARLVAVGRLARADAEASEIGEVRAAILGLTPPGGPVRT